MLAVAAESNAVKKFPFINLTDPPTTISPLIPAPPETCNAPVPVEVEPVLEVIYSSEAPMAEVDGIVKFLFIAIDIY